MRHHAILPVYLLIAVSISLNLGTADAARSSRLKLAGQTKRSQPVLSTPRYHTKRQINTNPNGSTFIWLLEDEYSGQTFFECVDRLLVEARLNMDIVLQSI
jgi:hypothetical protein